MGLFLNQAMKKYYLWVLFLLPLSVYSQQQASSLLRIQNGSAAIELENLSIRIDIVGNIAQTPDSASVFARAGINRPPATQSMEHRPEVY